MLLQVRKQDGRIEDFSESKLIGGVLKAGASQSEAELVLQEVKEALIGRELVTTEELSTLVVTALEKIDKPASEAFVSYRAAKLAKAKEVKKVTKKKTKAKKTTTKKKTKKTTKKKTKAKKTKKTKKAKTKKSKTTKKKTKAKKTKKTK